MSDGINTPYFQEDDYTKKGWFSSLFQFIQRRTKVVVVTTTYSVASDVFWVRCNATGGAFTVTLPESLTWGGRQIGLIKTDASANAVTVARDGADLINGAASISLATQYTKALLIADGTTNWGRMT